MNGLGLIIVMYSFRETPLAEAGLIALVGMKKTLVSRPLKVNRFSKSRALCTPHKAGLCIRHMENRLWYGN